MPPMRDGCGAEMKKRYRLCRTCENKWNVSRKADNPKQYICPICEHSKGRSSLEQTNGQRIKRIKTYSKYTGKEFKCQRVVTGAFTGGQ